MASENLDDRSPFTRPAFLISAGMVILLVAAALWLLTTGKEHSNDQTTSPATAVAAATASAAQASTSDSVCGLPAGDQGEPTRPLGSAVIEVARGLSVPQVQGVGPGVTEEVTRCFAHSPTGAVVAAANWMKWLSSRQQLPTVTQTLMAPGADRDRLLEQVKTSWDGSTGSAVTVVGYKVEVRSSDEVVVDMAVADPGDITKAVSWPLVMAWQEGDWKVVPPANDSWGEEAVTSLYSQGFVPWTI